NVATDNGKKRHLAIANVHSHVLPDERRGAQGCWKYDGADASSVEVVTVQTPQHRQMHVTRVDVRLFRHEVGSARQHVTAENRPYVRTGLAHDILEAQMRAIVFEVTGK